MRGLLLATCAAFLAGCSPPPRTSAVPEKPFASVALKLQCADAKFADAIAPMARVWAAKTGATVEIVPTAMPPGAAGDLAIVPAPELGFWAERGELLAVPIALREPGHPYHWPGVLPAYRGEQMAGWGSQIIALPLCGDGFVLVYDADRFDGAAAFLYATLTDRELAPPATWEDYAAIVRFFATEFDGKPAQPKPCLPLFPTDPARAADFFFRVASCYDRPALGEAEQGGAAAFARDPLAFQFHTETGQPRLNERSFQAAANWLAELRMSGALPAPGGSDDPVAALTEGRAVMAVLSLSELARLPRVGGRVPRRFAVAPLPGTREYLNAAGDAMNNAEANYIPYCAGGRFGIVRKTCAHPEAAFDLLAEIGSPTRSLELLATPGLGAGPFRSSHPDHAIAWLGYGFDEEQTKVLRAALGQYLRSEVKNRTFGLRGPDQQPLTLAMGSEAAAIANGAVKPADGLSRANAAWVKIGSEYPGERLVQIRRRAVGLN